jgi:PadR family transcriptional regulator AphA
LGGRLFIVIRDPLPSTWFETLLSGFISRAAFLLTDNSSESYISNRYYLGETMRENRSRYAVLGLLSAHGSSTGYELKKKFEFSLAGFWSESYGQIYPILHKLAEEGLAKVREEVQGNRPNRKIYSITKKGREELRRWMVRPAAPPSERIEMLLKLFFGSNAKPSINARHIREFQKMHEGLLVFYQEVEQGARGKYISHPDFPYWRMVLSYGRYESKALIAWCKETLAKLKEMDPKEKEDD